MVREAMDQGRLELVNGKSQCLLSQEPLSHGVSPVSVICES